MFVVGYEVDDIAVNDNIDFLEISASIPTGLGDANRAFALDYDHT